MTLATTPKTALITGVTGVTGVTGQDGAYLAAQFKGSSRAIELSESCAA